MSGGKDSTATALVAIERGTENLRFVFADTGHEHRHTYEYIEYLEGRLGITIDRVKADFSRQIAGKREFIKAKWAEHGVPDSHISRALEGALVRRKTRPDTRKPPQQETDHE